MRRIYRGDTESLESFIERLYNDWYTCVKDDITTTYQHARKTFYKYKFNYEKHYQLNKKKCIEDYYQDMMYEFDKDYYKQYKKQKIPT